MDWFWAGVIIGVTWLVLWLWGHIRLWHKTKTKLPATAAMYNLEAARQIKRNRKFNK